MTDDTRKYVDGVDLSRLPLQAGPVLIALGQSNEGKPVTAICPACGHVISVEARGNPISAWVHSCPCGVCNGSFRGL